MIRADELLEFNKKLYKKYYKQKGQIGFFNNNHILVIGQNPGQPYNQQLQADTDNVYDEDFDSHTEKYEQMLHNTNMGKYLEKLFGSNWNHISVTNLVKIHTEKNDVPTKEMIEEHRPELLKQIELINPTLVILLGSVVANEFGLQHNEFKKINDIWYYAARHYSYLLRTNTLEAYSEELIKRINNFLKYNALIKVNNKRIYYRDIRFIKNFYFNACDSRFMFVKDSTGNDGVSYKGDNVKIVNKYDYTGNEETFEGHLHSSDLFYYNNIDKITHSKIIKYTVIDIETEMCNDILNPKKIISIVAKNNIDKQFNKWLLDTEKSALDGVMVFDKEVEMIEDFLNHIKDSDVIVGWYSNGFDVPYVINRAKVLGIQVEKYFHDLYLNITPNREVISLRCENMFFIDALNVYKRFVYYDKPKSFSLDNVAEHVLKEKKIKIENIIETYKKNKSKLIEYNTKDVDLTYRIIQKASVINYGLRLQQICPQDFEDFQWNSKIIENLLHHRYWHKKIYFPTKKEHTKLDYKGAIVLEPTPGLHKHVVVYDFSAMYTSIYVTFNYSPDTILDNPEKNCITVNTDIGQFYYLPKSNTFGILPKLEKELLEKRKEFQRDRDRYSPGSVEYHIRDELQGTFKTILNSIYGVAAYKKFILFDTRIPASITATARMMLEFVKQIAEEMNYSALYGDTDSIFMSIPGETFEEVLKNSLEFEKIVNKRFPEFIKRFTTDEITPEEHILKLDLEKIYSSLLLTDVKKRYFGKIKYYKGKTVEKEKVLVTGFDTRRDDTPLFFKKALTEVYEKILDGDIKEIKAKCNEIYNNMFNTDIEDFVINIKLSKHLEEYKNLPIHVRALQNSGETITRGENVKMLFVNTHKEVDHYVEGKKYNLNYEKYFTQYIKNKIKLINEEMWRKLFDEQNRLSEWL